MEPNRAPAVGGLVHFQRNGQDASRGHSRAATAQCGASVTAVMFEWSTSHQRRAPHGGIMRGGAVGRFDQVCHSKIIIADPGPRRKPIPDSFSTATLPPYEVRQTEDGLTQRPQSTHRGGAATKNGRFWQGNGGQGNKKRQKGMRVEAGKLPEGPSASWVSTLHPSSLLPFPCHPFPCRPLLLCSLRRRRFRPCVVQRRVGR